MKKFHFPYKILLFDILFEDHILPKVYGREFVKLSWLFQCVTATEWEREHWTWVAGVGLITSDLSYRALVVALARVVENTPSTLPTIGVGQGVLGFPRRLCYHQGYIDNFFRCWKNGEKSLTGIEFSLLQAGNSSSYIHT